VREGVAWRFLPDWEIEASCRRDVKGGAASKNPRPWTAGRAHFDRGSLWRENARPHVSVLALSPLRSYADLGPGRVKGPGFRLAARRYVVVLH
jgi:hypothetical protein